MAYPVTDQSIAAHRGDLIQFWIRLYNPNPSPIPYLVMALHWNEYFKEHPREMEARIRVGWLVSPTDIVEALVPPVILRLDPDPFYSLAYVRRSTRLTAPDRQFHYPLPDGIMGTNAPLLEERLKDPHVDWFLGPLTHGLSLANIGPPTSCHECAEEYIRFVSFEAQVV